MATIVIYTTSWCPFCTRAKKLLDQKNVTYTEVDVSSSDARAKMVARTGGSTVPQLVINDQPTGGCDELYALERSGKLEKLLSR